jgi:hypothetical protein
MAFVAFVQYRTSTVGSERPHILVGKRGSSRTTETSWPQHTTLSTARVHACAGKIGLLLHNSLIKF